MKIELKTPPRTFRVGLAQQIEIADCGNVYLDADQQVTFLTPSGKEYDLAAKSWGFYATPSVNGRLKQQGFKTALVRNSKGQVYVMIVELNKVSDFLKYLEEDAISLLEWLDERPLI